MKGPVADHYALPLRTTIINVGQKAPSSSGVTSCLPGPLSSLLCGRHPVLFTLTNGSDTGHILMEHLLCARPWRQGSDTGKVPVAMKLTSFLREADNVNTYLTWGRGWERWRN